MANIPDDPTKAQIWITGEAPNLVLDAYIPAGSKGDKGEPGGLTAATEIGTQSLDTLTTPGMYKQTQSANVTTANGYPFTRSVSMNVRVYANSTLSVQQEAVIVSAAVPTTYTIWRRTIVSGVVGEWRAFNSTRIDQTAGRAIYQWDDANNREQLIYGDTGYRNINTLAPTLTSGTIFLRRTGTWVEIVLTDVVFSNPDAGILTLTGLIPTGFRSFPWIAGILGTGQQVKSTPVEFRIYTHKTVSSYSGSLAFNTNDAWPTTLPGAASGTLPNM